MARIRSLKPEFWDDRKLARSTSRDARMLYMALWNQADEHGRLNGDAVWLKGRAFPYDDDVEIGDLKAMLDELENAERIVRYEVEGDPFIFLPKLAAHQRLEPAKVPSRLPEPPNDGASAPRPDGNEPRADHRADSSETDSDKSAPRADSSTLLYVAGVRGQGSGSRGQDSGARGARIPDDWTPDDALIDAMRREGIPDELARRELPRFRDYWTAQPGAKGRKSDWPATWRNWLRRAADEHPRSTASRTQTETDEMFNRAAQRMGVNP